MWALSTALAALKVYRRPSVLHSTDEPNFNADEFVGGGPRGDRADTIYITGTGDDQASVAPLVVGLLDEIRAATIRRHRRFERERERAYGAQQDVEESWPVTLCLDELTDLAPLPKLPSILKTAGARASMSPRRCTVSGR